MWYHTQMDFRLVLYIVIREDMAVVQLRLGKSKTMLTQGNAMT